MQLLINLALREIKALWDAINGLRAQVAYLINNPSPGGGGVVSQITAGTGSPENVVVGGSPYIIYIDTQNNDMYVFFGTAGQTSPWVIR